MARRGKNALRLASGNRLNLVQARLNDTERAKVNELRLKLGLTDSQILRAGLAALADSINQSETASI